MKRIRSISKIPNLGPLALLYYLSISEIDSHFESYFEILSFNIQLIIIYYWSLKRPEVLGNGHVFFAGLINDTVVGLPLGISSLSYLLICVATSYFRQITIRPNPVKDWFYFLFIIIFVLINIYSIKNNCISWIN